MPTSGAGPYTLSAVIENPYNVDGVLYTATLKSSAGTGECPTTGAATEYPQNTVDSLLADGFREIPTPVPSGSCRAFSLRLIRVSDGVEVDISTVYVDNI